MKEKPTFEELRAAFAATNEREQRVAELNEMIVKQTEKRDTEICKRDLVAKRRPFR